MMKTGLEKLKEGMQNGVNSLNEFPDMGFKRGYESCSSIILIKIDELIEEESMKKDPWISVEDRLPEIDESVLLLIDGDAIEGSFNPLSKDSWNRVSVISLPSHGCGCCAYDDEDPTHWMELPTPPQTKQV